MPSTHGTTEGAHEDDDDDDDDEDLSDVDVDAMVQDDGSDEEIDIRGLVGKGRKSNMPPPSKKQRKA